MSEYHVFVDVDEKFGSLSICSVQQLHAFRLEYVNSVLSVCFDKTNIRNTRWIVIWFISSVIDGKYLTCGN